MLYSPATLSVGDGVLDVPFRRGGRLCPPLPRDSVGHDAHIAPQRKALSFRASACREARALRVHTGVGIHTSPTHFPRLPLPATKARPGGARSRLSKKPVIASQCAPRSKCPWGTHWRGNPFLKRINSAFFADFCLKRYGFPRRFAPRNDRGEVYRHAEARPGGARSCLFRYRSFMPEYLLLQRENAG